MGAVAAAENIPVGLMTQNYLIFRDCAIAFVQAVARQLHSPPALMGAVRRELARSTDASLVSVARTYDRQLQLTASARDQLAEQLERKVESRTQELARKNAELLKMDELRTRFVSNASHELRTPLTAIRAFSELLADDESLTNSQREFALAINLESERLTRLANDLLDLSRIQTGASKWVPRSLDLHAEMGRLVRVQRPLAERRGLRLQLELPDRLAEVWADPDALRQVLSNLTTNALKFTEQGCVHLSAVETPEHVCITVADTGPGISPDDLEHIFDAFYQSGDMLTEKPAGAGLGLTICREILVHHGSELCVQSELGKGSRFSFALPKTPPS